MLGTGVAFPERFCDGADAELSNEDVIRLMSPRGPRGPRGAEEIALLAASLAEALGVRRRRWAHRVGEPFAEGEATAVDLQLRALQGALDQAGIAPARLGAVLTATSTPPRVTSPGAPAVAQGLGVRCACLDLRAGCAGGVAALTQGALLAAASQQVIAVVAGDTFSKLIPPGVPLAGLALADGAGAVLLGPGPGGAAGLLGAALDADGALGYLGSAPAPFPPTEQALRDGRYFLTADPEALARVAPGLYGEVVGAALQAAGLGPGGVDLFIPHQAGQALVQGLARQTGIDPARVFCEVARHANTGAASVLVGLHEALQEGRAAPGQVVLLAALGGGLNWAAAALRL